MITNVIDISKREVSGINAKRYVADITRYHRIQTSPGLHDALCYVKSRLEEFGYEPKIYSYPADGKVEYLGFRSPIGWRISDGELKVVKPKEIFLGRFIDNPTLIVAHSGPAPEGVEAELVDVGKGIYDHEYRDDVSGKFVLASGHLRVVFKKAVMEREAIGIIHYSQNVANPHAYPYKGLWPRKDELEKIPPMFSIPFEKAIKLKDLLGKDKVVVYGRVDSSFYEGAIELLEARIPGKRNKDVALIAHICHPMPGANDNASGSGLLLELARASMKLYKNKLIDIGYGLRFWWAPEFSGIYAHLAENPGLEKKIVSVINLDMVGGKQDIVGGVLTIIGMAEFNPTFIPALAYYIFEKVVEGPKAYARPETLPAIKFKLIRYSGGSDHHVFVDPFRNIPATAFIEWPDRYYHSDLDIIDNIDPGLLKTIGTAALSLALTISRINEEYFRECLYILANFALSSLQDITRKTLGEAKWFAMKKINLLSRMYAEAIKSFSIFKIGRENANILQEMSDEIMNAGRELMNEVEQLSSKGLFKEAEEPLLKNDEVYARTRKSIVKIVDVYEKVRGEDSEWWLRKVIDERNSSIVDLFYLLVDGKRTLGEIYDILKLDFKELKPEELIKIAEILEKAGWLKRS